VAICTALQVQGCLDRVVMVVVVVVVGGASQQRSRPPQRGALAKHEASIRQGKTSSTVPSFAWIYSSL
jgi:hypothetical protein